MLQEQSLTCALAGVKVSPTTRQPQASQYIKDILMNRKVTVKAYSISPKTNELLVDLATPDFPSVRQHVLLVQVCFLVLVFRQHVLLEYSFRICVPPVFS